MFARKPYYWLCFNEAEVLTLRKTQAPPNSLLNAWQAMGRD